MPDAGTGRSRVSWLALAGYLAIGAYFGAVLTKSEAISWFRIQEMFRFDSVHMYGLIGSAVIVAAVSLILLRGAGVTALNGEPIAIEPKESTPGMVRYWAGGTMFGAGWALLGACPGPLYSLVGAGVTAYIVAIVAALLGTFCYGQLAKKLPH